MLKNRTLVCVLMLGGLTFGSAGCDLFTIPDALTKLANCEIGSLTATEIRVLSEIAADAINTSDPSAGAEPLTQDQAQAIVNFLAANNVQTCDDLQDLFDQSETDPGSIQGLAELAAAFQSSEDEFDPENVTREDLQNVFDFF